VNNYEPGDEIIVTVKGKVASPSDYRPVIVGVHRDAPYAPDAYSRYGVPPSPPGFDLGFSLDTNATVTWEHKSQHKNGVHIDADGQYWMRRPDGWHQMFINGDLDDRDLANVRREPTPLVQRLVEPKDK
jgi:hypothetical protein